MENSIELSKNSFGIEHGAHYLGMSQIQNVCVYHVLMDVYKAMFYGDFWTFGSNFPNLTMNICKL